MEKAAFDPVRFKEQERAGFNFVAQRYENAMRTVQAATEQLIKLGNLEAGMRVLDVATGPGLIALRAAQLVGASGSVVGIDIAEEALAIALQRANEQNLGLRVSFEVEDAEALSFEDHSFDRVFCGMALMHFPDPDAALRQFKRVLKPGGKLVASVWGEEKEAPFIAVALQTLKRNLPPPKIERPSMFRFGRADTLTQLVEAAGFTQVQTEQIKLEYRFPDAPAYWQTFLDAAGITAIALARQSEEVRTHLEKDVATDLEPFRAEPGYYLPSMIRAVVATA